MANEILSAPQATCFQKWTIPPTSCICFAETPSRTSFFVLSFIQLRKFLVGLQTPLLKSLTPHSLFVIIAEQSLNQQFEGEGENDERSSPTQGQAIAKLWL
ncbi:MAG: hypothetical protein N3B10_02730 [Armatimonadetes bacterium]|nr:hypothetical protein [Armatimonadota bacterium]